MEDHRNEQFVEVDLSGARFRGADLSGVTISDAWVHDVDISGDVRGLTVNGVDVTGYVEAELDRRHPERLLLLRAADPEGLRLAWAAVEGMTAATVDRARARPVDELEVSVDEEWSYLETLRHLVFATDRWITGPVLEEPRPFHPIGRPNDPLEEVPEGLVDLEADPTLDTVLAVRRTRMDRVAGVIGSTDVDGLQREVTSPNGGTTTVLHCLQVVLREEWWHDQYANRDLGILEAAGPASGGA